MQKLCDLFLCEPTKTNRLKFVNLFDKKFLYDSEREYRGYLGVNIPRIKMVSIVCDIRKHSVCCFSAPIEYRDGQKISIALALSLASDYAMTINAKVAKRSNSTYPPVYWVFDLLWINQSDERAGGTVMIDRLDGHLWTSSEYEEYMYDYNNII